MKRRDEDLKKKHEKELKALRMKISEQTGQIEEERKLRAKQLKDKGQREKERTRGGDEETEKTRRSESSVRKRTKGSS